MKEVYKIKGMRVVLGISQRDLASQFNITVNYMYKIENNLMLAKKIRKQIEAYLTDLYKQRTHKTKQGV